MGKYKKLNISDTIYCDRVEYRFLLRRCTSKSCYLGCHGNSIRRYFKFYLKTNISHGICVWWEQMVWSLQMQQFPPLKKRWIGGATSKTVWRADGRWQHLQQHWENPPPSFWRKERSRCTTRSGYISLYVSWFWTISPQRSFIHTPHLLLIFFPFVSTVAIQKDVGGILSI